MAQQTAVEWLLSQEFGLDIGSGIQVKVPVPKEIAEQAKQMEKEQLVKAWDDGDYAYFYSKETGRDFDNGEQYYNETYSK